VISLPDVNVLLALIWSNHPHHQAAHQWFARHADAGWATCIFTQTGFLRLSMNPRVVGVAIDCRTVLELLEGLVAHPHHHYVETAPSMLEPPFGELAPHIVGYRQVPDATLLHLARIHQMKLLTFDQAVANVCPWEEHLETILP